jgi:hypothetical protein
MAPHDHDAPAATEAQRKAAWGIWIDDILTVRTLRNAELVRRLDAVAEELGIKNPVDPSSVSQWRKGTLGPSETAALLVAKALELPQPLVLRAAGHHAAAALIESEPRTDDPLLARIRRAGLSEHGQATVERFVQRENETLKGRVTELLELLDEQVEHGERLLESDRRREQAQDARTDHSAS